VKRSSSLTDSSTYVVQTTTVNQRLRIRIVSLRDPTLFATMFLFRNFSRASADASPECTRNFSASKSERNSDAACLRRSGITRKFRARTDVIVFSEILLAALLKLCNAAEEFLRAELKNLADDARFAR